MAYYRKWKPSKSAAREFAQTMEEITDFCREHGICKSSTSDSYYFSLNGKRYRVSNHTIAASDKGMYRPDPVTGVPIKVRESYHPEEDDTICITASKTRIIDIYNDLANGYELDGRGFRKNR